ncbi:MULTISPECIES: hypothetical protein [unclassified Chelatococcus]|uniref:hypothetical protein n=1 Tax=unclassified Chelatococcus TaxID=2638111 RepID=UPI001BCF67D9|nr:MULTISPECIES: hypothetical protein [unclassified Chelatococcus]CAH1670751.1 conserved hypothetical protein [Hyphomicrobiales bacterium]MBS7738376.1 hypothetical protein [Chelatococcus sp. HY11]MBX3547355.1 hypothetical protein [Chelatococcus sp.]MCO5077278.1 hypothetical protein [Chelatococcus sp.]CAH1677023.1 conserved hypothetical protein [Hyphomicrobiales bacterium]
MAVRVRAKFVNRDVVAFVKQGVSAEATAKIRANVARQVLADAQEQNRRATGRVPEHETYVDGRKGAPLESVKPTGTVVFEFDLYEGVFAWIGEQLVLHSPALTGDYRASHLFLADGVPIEAGAKVPEAGEYVFVNSQPYARKIERGQSDQAPDGVYEAVAALAARRFGNIAAIKYSFRALDNGALLAYQPAARVVKRIARGQFGAGRFTATGEDRTAQRREQSLRQPAIVIRLR